VYTSLDSTGMLTEGTVIIVVSDNGGYPCGIEMSGSNSPLRGSKFKYQEGAFLVLGFVYSSDSGAAAGLIPSASVGSSYTGLMHHVDWLSTFATLADVTVDDSDVDGVDQWSAIAGDGDVSSPRDEVRSLPPFSLLTPPP